MLFQIIWILLSINLSKIYGTPTNSEPKIYEKCRGPGDPGPCKEFIYKWRYEQTSGECVTFVWGGCQGNENNRFDTRDECLAHCIGEPEHTMPAYLTSTLASIKMTTTTQKIQNETETTPFIPVGAVPLEGRGAELTFRETGHTKQFMFAENNTFIQIDGDTIQTFQLRLCREISFQFRTRLPHGLLVYHNVQNPEKIELNPYALYVIVEKGQLKVVHVFGKHSTSVIVGEGLNRDEWHKVMVRIDVHGARLIARVDDNQEEVYLKGLNHDTNYGVSKNLPSVVLVGGLSSEEKLHGVKYIIESFVGCIQNIVLSSGKAASDLLPISPLIASKHENVQEGCRNKCYTSENLCFVGSRCINHYHDFSCDCFGTNYEGEQCDIYSATVLTLRGSSYVSYRIYDWKDRVHSPQTRISLLFKTKHDDSVLFYASGEALKPQYIAASIKNNSAYVEMDFGNGTLSATLGSDLTKNYWHNLTIYHDKKTVKVILDNEMKIIEGGRNLLFDPEIYFGGGPDLKKKKGLASHNNFAGSLKYVFYNDVAVLYELRKGNPKVHYIGILAAEFVETDVDVIPITYPFATSHIWWPIEHSDELNLKFDFRSSRNYAVLAYSEVTTENQGNGYWEIRLSTDKISFDLYPNDEKSNVTVTNFIEINSNKSTAWHAIELNYKDGVITLTVDYRYMSTKMYGVTFNVGNKIIIGSSLRAASSGLVGCMRDLYINGYEIEPRYVVQTERVVGEIALDNCNYVDPCKRPNACEHNGKCFVQNDRTTCDCKGTGYIGKNCHFTEYRKTCEELALLGYTKSTVYLIDIDGNGVFPPAHVKCDFQSLENATKTIVEHNLPSQVDIRKHMFEDFSYQIKYREFSAEMLQELISHSLYCTQSIKYECFKAPLDLHSATWFQSSYENQTVDSIGNVKRGTCPCAKTKTCADPNHSCNCDKLENRWLTDEGVFRDPQTLGITSMYFLQQKNLDEDAIGRITLGPLECVETNTQKYVVTFTTSQSFIEVPGWRKGDIAFSFRTTGEQAILLFQPPIRANFPSFLVALTGDYQLTFNFTLNTGSPRNMVVNSNRKLNGGEWHKIWIDYNEYHIRFMINKDYQMVNLSQQEQFGPFEGSMYIGGAPADLLKKASVKQGLIGCFRGLVVNGEILDIYSYMSVHLSEIIKDCKPSCVPSPCKNGAFCKELWSTFQCVCKNPWAHVGELCDENYNEKALTFVNRESYLKKNYLGISNSSEYEKNQLSNILKEDLLINIRTYDKHALILYANDHFNNFVHLYITNSNEIVYSFNYGNEIINLTVFNNDLSSGKSIQIAVLRNENSTILHVNNLNISVERGFHLLTNYSNKPWINPELEVLSPHRPPAPPTEYFQFNLGGYDPTNLLKTNPNGLELEGFIGCIRGLKIGKTLFELGDMIKDNIAHISEGVLPNCQMRCDAEPCKNGGICTENFAKQESTCNCDHTSFMGEFCNEEKGAEFSGESALQRKYVLEGKVEQVKLQLAFSSQDLRRTNRVMLLLQAAKDSSYYLMIGINPDGQLYFEEDIEGNVYTFVSKHTVLDNARHSIYYMRNLSEAILYVDRVLVNLDPISRPQLTQATDIDTNKVTIGGINTTDTRFVIHKSYSGCLSNIYIEVNNLPMRPLEEYMYFTKSGAETITVINSQGVRSAQCNSHFDTAQKLKDEPIQNVSLGTDNWLEDSPVKIFYKSVYVDPSEEEEQTQFVFIILISLFIIIIICCAIEVYRTDRAHKKRIERETDEGIIKMRQATQEQFRKTSYKSITSEDPEKPLVGILKNGSTHSVKFAPEPEKVRDHENREKKSEKELGFRESQLIDHEPQWDSLIAESQNPPSTPTIESQQPLIDSRSDHGDDMPGKAENGDCNKLPKFSNVSGRARFRQLSFPPPIAPLNSTQLPFKLDEENDESEPYSSSPVAKQIELKNIAVK